MVFDFQISAFLSAVIPGIEFLALDLVHFTNIELLVLDSGHWSPGIGFLASDSWH